MKALLHLNALVNYLLYLSLNENKAVTPYKRIPNAQWYIFSITSVCSLLLRMLLHKLLCRLDILVVVILELVRNTRLNGIITISVNNRGV